MIFLAVKRPLGSLTNNPKHPARNIIRLEILAKINKENIRKIIDKYVVKFLLEDILYVSNDKNKIIQQVIQGPNMIAILEKDYSKNIVEFDTEEEAKLYFELMD